MASFYKSTSLQTSQTLVKTEGQFPTVGSLATMSLDYKPFQQSGPPTKLKEATFVAMNFHFIDAACRLTSLCEVCFYATDACHVPGVLLYTLVYASSS